MYDGKFLSVGKLSVTLTPARNGNWQDVLIGSHGKAVCFEGAVPPSFDAQQAFNALEGQARVREDVREKFRAVGVTLF